VTERCDTVIPVVVTAGETLSGIAAQYGVSYQAIAADSGISDPNLIYAGQTVEVPTAGGGSVSITPTTPAWTPSAAQAAPVDTGGGLSDVPGVPSSFASCVAFRESTDGQASSNVYGILDGPNGADYGVSLAQQKQDFATLYAQDGTQPWAPSDGC
jgi:LysM repeat protein